MRDFFVKNLLKEGKLILRKKQLTAAVLAVTVSLSAFVMPGCSSQTKENAQSVDSKESTDSAFVFEKINGGYELKEYTGDNPTPNIPEEYMDEPVISVGDGAFTDNDTLTQIWFPPSITTVGDGAFKNCSELTVAMIPETVCYVGSNVFAGCDKLSIECEAGADQSMFWAAQWNPDQVPVTWESRQGVETLAAGLIKDAGMTILKSCGSSFGSVLANTIMSELGFGDQLDPRYTEELEKVRDELTKLNEQTERIENKLNAIEREMLTAADRTELNSRMSTINQHISKINTLYEEYLDLANADDAALRKSYSVKLAEKIEEAGIPTMIKYIHAELTDNNGGIQNPILELYNGFLEKVHPFKHESGELTRIFYEHISGIETMGTVLHTAFCNYQQKNDPDNAAYYKEQNDKLLEKVKGYLEKQSSMIPQEESYKTVVGSLSVSGKGEYQIFRMISNNNGKEIYLMDHALPATDTIVKKSFMTVQETDPDDDMYMTNIDQETLVVPQVYINNLARTTVADLIDFFSVKDVYGGNGMSNFDFLIHHLPDADLSGIKYRGAGPFVLVTDKPSGSDYLPGVLINNLSNGLVSYTEGQNNIMNGSGRVCDTLILWTDNNNQPDMERLAMYFERVD